MHPKFHAGEQRTLFRPGKDEAFQLDHLLCDRRTWDAATTCEVLQVPYLGELSDTHRWRKRWRSTDTPGVSGPTGRGAEA